MQPESPDYDVAWHVLDDYATGSTLKTALEKYELANLIDPIKEYLEEVRLIRAEYPALRAPELLPIYELVKAPAADRFHIQKQIHQYFGGDWKNVFEYARIWAFVLPDWTLQIRDRQKGDWSIGREELFIRLPGFDGHISFPAFVWNSSDGNLKSPSIGFLADSALPDPVRFLLGSFSAPGEGRQWECLPRIFALDRRTGQATLLESSEAGERLIQALDQLASAAQIGPYLPLASWKEPGQCQHCLFRDPCINPRRDAAESGTSPLSGSVPNHDQ